MTPSTAFYIEDHRESQPMARWNYPAIDIAAVAKGDVFTRDFLEEMFGVGVEFAAYQSNLIGLAEDMQAHLRELGNPCTVKIEGRELLVLEDADASRYNREQVRQYSRRARAAMRRQREVVPANIKDPEARRLHERSLVVNATYEIGLMQMEREIPKVPHVRKTPGLPTPA
jgi:hypothetical protein